MSDTTFRSYPRDVSLCSEVGSLMMTPMSLLIVVTSCRSSIEPGGATRCNIPKAQLPNFAPPPFKFRPIGRTGRPSLMSATIGGAPQRISELTLSRFTELRLQTLPAKHIHTAKLATLFSRGPDSGPRHYSKKRMVIKTQEITCLGHSIMLARA